jgi:hypothetical protein
MLGKHVLLCMLIFLENATLVHESVILGGESIVLILESMHA